MSGPDGHVLHRCRAQLGRHRKPILIANISGFWDPLCVLFDHMKKTGFIRPELAVDPIVVERVEDIMPRLREAARAPKTDRKGAPATIERL